MNTFVMFFFTNFILFTLLFGQTKTSINLSLDIIDITRQNRELTMNQPGRCYLKAEVTMLSVKMFLTMSR